MPKHGVAGIFLFAMSVWVSEAQISSGSLKHEFKLLYMGRKRWGAATSNAPAVGAKGLRANGACMAEKGYLRD